MKKPYKIFHEIGNNRYYILKVENMLYIGTESFIKAKKRFSTQKYDYFTQGFKLMETSPIMLLLFNMIKKEVNVLPEQEDLHEGDLKYSVLDHKKVISTIIDTYEESLEREKELAEDSLEETIDSLDKDDKDYDSKIALLKARHKKFLKVLEDYNPIGTKYRLNHINSKDSLYSMIKEGKNHLYTEAMNSFADITYLYELDDYATLTIYKIIKVKTRKGEKIKSVDTFIYNKDIIEKFFNKLESEDK